MEDINDRMELLVNERFDGNKAAFAKSIGLPPTSMSSYLGNKRRSKPSVDMVTKIVVNLGVDARWLLTGEGSAKTCSVETKGDYSPASFNGPASVEVKGADAVNAAVLEERVKSLQALLDEKERTIQILMEGRK